MSFKEKAEDLGLEEREYIDLMHLFLKTTKENVKIMQTAIESEDSERVSALAHKVKGASLNLDVSVISDTAKRIEEIVKRGDLTDASQPLERITSELDKITKLLSKNKVYK